MFVIYVCTKLHMRSSTKSLHTAIIKLTAKKAETQKFSVLFCSLVLRQMQPMASPLLRFPYYLWTYGKTDREPAHQGLYRENADIIHPQNGRWTHNTNI
jgi:hypothetical protein